MGSAIFAIGKDVVEAITSKPGRMDGPSKRRGATNDACG